MNYLKKVLFALLLTAYFEDVLTIRNPDLCPQNCVCYSEEVSCQNGNLSSIPDGIKPKIKTLNLHNNKITEIPIRIRNLINLETLILSHNRITKLDKFRLNISSLLTLDLSFNSFTSWNQIQPDALNWTENILELDLSHNKFENGNIRYSLKSNSLLDLNLKHCGIGSFPKLFLSDLSSLQQLIIAENYRLREINSLASSSLQILDATNCALEVVNLSNFPRLTRATLRGGRIKYMPIQNFQNLNLQFLDLSDNGIKFIDSGVFKNLPELKTLDLSENVFVDLHPNMFQKNAKLENLIISHTYLKKIVSFNSDSLKNLDLSINEIQTFPEDSLISMPSLQNLNLYRNLISRLPNSILSISLQYLNLSTCQIIEIKEKTFSNLLNLRYLDLSNNRLTYFKRNYFPISLHEINLDRNLWRCECFSKDFKDQYDYLMHPYELATQNSLICHSPENVSGLSWVEACGPIWDGINTSMAQQGKMWLYIISMVLAMSVIFCATMCIRRMHQVKVMREQAERMRQRMEAQERINRLRREQQQQIQAQQNAPDPRELQRPPSYHEAIRMPRIDGSYSSLAASRVSLAASRQSIRASRASISINHAISHGSLAASNPDLSKSQTQDREGRERTTSKSSTGRPRRSRTPRASRRRRRRSRADTGEFDTQSVPDLAGDGDDEATRSMILDSERSEAGEQSEAVTDNDPRDNRVP